MCVPPAYGFVGTVIAVAIQLIMGCVSLFGQQWLNCNFSWAQEFSFGMRDFKLRMLVINQEITLRQLAGVSPDIQKLVDANGGIMGVTISGMVLGVIAAGLATFCLFEDTKYKRSIINWIAGLLAVDAILVLVGWFVFNSQIKPNLRDLGIDALIRSVAGIFNFEIGYFQGMALTAGTRCSSQEQMAGSILAMVQFFLIGTVTFVMGALVDSGPKEEDARMIPNLYNWGKGKGKGGQWGGPPGMVQMQQFQPGLGKGGPKGGPGAFPPGQPGPYGPGGPPFGPGPPGPGGAGGPNAQPIPGYDQGGKGYGKGGAHDGKGGGEGYGKGNSQSGGQGYAPSGGQDYGKSGSEGYGKGSSEKGGQGYAHSGAQDYGKGGGAPGYGKGGGAQDYGQSSPGIAPGYGKGGSAQDYGPGGVAPGFAQASAPPGYGKGGAQDYGYGKGGGHGYGQGAGQWQGHHQVLT